MPFKQNNIISNDDSQVLNDILTAIHQLKSSVDNLNQRMNKLESATNNKQIESISTTSEQLKKNIDKVSNNSAIQFLIILAITFVILIGGIISSVHSWDVPAQTNAVNQYIYEKTFKEQNLNHQ
ncbi:hypothetical protein IJ556_03910 [bacterium]|nr:hypothetical protein [bacterium]